MQVIAHNMLSQFTNRQLNITDKNKSKSSEKLSSGFRINRASDDAAGLAISEKLRWQVRGLNKGKQNIQDGISLVQTAEGALNEVHAILQRVRELSLQAYNDTNTRSDREAIQTEIDHCIAEIGKIATDTTFNTKHILLGNPGELVKVTEDTPAFYVVNAETTIQKPNWLIVDPKMEVHSSYNQAPGNKDGIMKVSQPDGSIWYYGAKNPGITDAIWYGDTPQGIAEGYGNPGWNNTIADNATAKVDFRNLSNDSTLDDLYFDLFSLMGTQLRFTCGTCDWDYQGVFFSGSAEGITLGDNAVADTTVYPAGHYNYNSVNLSSGHLTFTDSQGNTYEGNGYFELIDNVTIAQAQTDDAMNPVMTDAQKAAQTTELADFIAKNLRNRTYNALDTSYHFDRAVKTAGDDYSLIMYDYRDSSRATAPTAMNASVSTIGDANISIQIDTIKPGQTVWAEKPLVIMAGALSSSYLTINLPDLAEVERGLKGYSVSHYDEVEHYSTAYAAKMNDWLANGFTHTARTETYTTNVWKIDSIDRSWVNGELHTNVTGHMEQQTGTRTITVTERTPRPQALPGDITIEETYAPDSLWSIDYAIDYVSDLRADLGATQNWLEHAYRLNDLTSENSQAAESRIRDTDMASEMVNQSKHSILQQAGQAMLSQANQLPNGVLQLLQ